MADWDTSNPDDNDIVSQYPSNERAARTAVVANFGVDHHETDDGDVGKHEVIQIIDNGGDATIDAGDIGLWNDGGVLKTRTGTGSVATLASTGDITEPFPAGTRMLFHQATTPPGWTQATNVNDRVMRVVSGGSGGGTGGNWTISGLNVQNHTLSLSQIPSHNHGGGGNTGLDGSHSHSGSTSTTGNHTHSILRDYNQFTGNPTKSWIDTVSQSNSTTPVYETNNGFNNWLGTDGNHNHSLSINGVGDHRHTYTINTQGGGGAHNHGITHNGNWRPSYTDVIVGIKD